jgi:lysophospholipase L1-like esterase
MVAQLTRRLGVPVANLGQSNYGPQQELAVLERYAVPLAPKVVLWFLFGGNDLTDIDRYAQQQQQRGQLRPPTSFSSRSFTRNALWAIARLTTPVRDVPSPAAQRHAATFVTSSGEAEILYLDAPEGPWHPRQWEVLSGTLLKARDITRRIGADLLVVYIPRKLRVYRGFLRAEPGAAAHTWELNNLPEVVGAWCRAHDVAFLDSTLPLRQAVGSGTSVYLPEDVHWNAAGHEVVAAAVADRLREIGSPPSDRLGLTK